MFLLLLVGLYHVSLAIGGFISCLACYWCVQIKSLLLFVGSYHVSLAIGGFKSCLFCYWWVYIMSLLLLVGLYHVIWCVFHLISLLLVKLMSFSHEWVSIFCSDCATNMFSQCQYRLVHTVLAPNVNQLFIFLF